MLRPLNSAAVPAAICASLSLPLIPPPAAQGAAEVPSRDPDSAFVRAGRDAYQTVCVGCHQPEGQGVPGAFPPLAGSPWVAGDPARMLKIVLNGLSGPLEINGQPFNLEMPPQGPLLTDLQVAQVATFVRNSWGNEGEAVDPAMVTALRREFEDRFAYWTTDELLKAHPLSPSAGETADGDFPLRDMKFAVFEGSWNRLPDFATLEAADSGDLPGNRIDLKVRGGRNERFGIRFTGRIEIPVDGEYTFQLASDDGSRLSIGGTTVVDADGIHAMGAPKPGRIRLAKGSHPVVLDYFEQGGEEQIYLGWSGPGFDELPLSKGARRGGGNEPSGILLAADGMRARIYRAFIEGVGQRAIGVGYPGNVNLAYDADNLFPAMLWRGPFIDAAKHWSGRGAGNQPPANPNVARLGDGVPFARLVSPSDAWPKELERDSRRLRETPYRFRGYALDENGWPTFRYSFGGMAVTDRFAPVPFNDQPLDRMATDTLERTLTVQGGEAPGEGPLYFRAASGAVEQDGDHAYRVGDRVLLVFPSDPHPRLRRVLRTSEGRQELLVEVNPGSEPVEIRTRIQFIQ